MAWATSSLPVPRSPRMRTVALVLETWAKRSKTSCMALDLPTMLAGWKRSFNLLCRRSFSSRRRSCSSMAVCLIFTAWAIMCATTDMTLMSSSRETPSSKKRSTLSAPITSCPSLMGTQIKEMSSFSRLLLAPVRSRKSGSSEMRGTTAARPVCTTLPVTPSPNW